MDSPNRGDGPFVAYWRRALGLPGELDRIAAEAAVQRLAVWLGWSLARLPVEEAVPEDTSEAAEAAFRRLSLARQAATINNLKARGLRILPIKGYGSARLYDPPWKRILGDLDLLVRPAEVQALVQELGAMGFQAVPSTQGALGVTSDVSFHPMVSSDGLVSVDIHTALDAFPLSSALGTDAVFDAADTACSGLASHHAAIAALSNLAKERFGPYSVRHLLDLGRLALQETVDWPLVDRIVDAAGLGPARATALGALLRIGVPAERLPAGIDPAFRPAIRLSRALGHLHLVEPSRWTKACRELAWCYAPGTIVRLWWFRIAGLLRPRSGMPPGADTVGPERQT
ncbi:nucleotidyltransferase family protein [Thalassobaculum sp.]|uniref:nucleotidyltransferase family protein n=1 Tax=Thalassobaculum sp. TaxID=2022740 RepID=UPI0032EB01D6